MPYPSGVIRLPLDRIEAGMRVARRIRYDWGGTMLEAGAPLTAPLIRRLRSLDMASIYVYDDDTADIETLDLVDERTQRLLTTRMEYVFRGLREETFRILRPQEVVERSETEIIERLNSERMQACVENLKLAQSLMPAVDAILSKLRTERELASCLGVMKTSASFLFDHSLEVSILAAMLGRHFGLNRDELEQLVLGCLLHDFGYVFVPEDITMKKGALTEDEEDLLRRHAALGYHFLKHDRRLSLLSAHVAYQHHEHQDGTGYPRGLKGANRVLGREESMGHDVPIIHRFSDIMIVPNAYVAWTEGRPYRRPVRADSAFRRVVQGMGSVFNAEVVRAFLSMVPCYPVGSYVRVEEGPYEGWSGVVARVHANDPSLPKVRLLYGADGSRLARPVHLELAADPVRIRMIV